MKCAFGNVCNIYNKKAKCIISKLGDMSLLLFSMKCCKSYANIQIQSLNKIQNML